MTKTDIKKLIKKAINYSDAQRLVINEFEFSTKKEFGNKILELMNNKDFIDFNYITFSVDLGPELTITKLSDLDIYSNKLNRLKRIDSSFIVSFDMYKEEVILTKEEIQKRKKLEENAIANFYKSANTSYTGD